MKPLLIIRPADVGATEDPDATFRERRAARAVMTNENGGVYLIHMKTRGYYKLPGGGIDEGEDIEAALHRELAEECGTGGTIIGELGSIEEFREDNGLHQISYCYLVKQQGQHAATEFEQGEVEDGAELVIAADITAAIHLVESSTPPDDECRFMQRRDSTFLREAQKLLKS